MLAIIVLFYVFTNVKEKEIKVKTGKTTIKLKTEEKLQDNLKKVR